MTVRELIERCDGIVAGNRVFWARGITFHGFFVEAKAINEDEKILGLDDEVPQDAKRVVVVVAAAIETRCTVWLHFFRSGEEFYYSIATIGG